MSKCKPEAALGVYLSSFLAPWPGPVEGKPSSPSVPKEVARKGAQHSNRILLI